MNAGYNSRAEVNNKMMFIAYALIWIAMSAAVSTGIYVTGKWSLLFFMIIPSLITLRHETTEDGKDKQGKD